MGSLSSKKYILTVQLDDTGYVYLNGTRIGLASDYIMLEETEEEEDLEPEITADDAEKNIGAYIAYAAFGNIDNSNLGGVLLSVSRSTNTVKIIDNSAIRNVFIKDITSINCYNDDLENRVWNLSNQLVSLLGVNTQFSGAVIDALRHALNAK